MFFDNRHYFRFVELCRQQGITVPIIPGLKVLSAQSQLKSIPRTFHCEIPLELADEVERAPAERALDIGIEWTVRQVRELFERGVPAVHFYIMQSATAVKRVLDSLRR
jgi:methylenetetrahydrofolate reductase (NADPH)